MRLIDADALIEKLSIDKECSVCEHNSDPYCKWKPNVVDVCEAICTAPTESDTISRPQWIPVTERLPEEDGDYWVTVDPRHVPPRYKSTDVITWHNGKWMMADYFVIDGEGQKEPKYMEVPVNIPILAWMPLLEPYHRP